MGVKVDPDRDVVQVDGSPVKVTAALTDRHAAQALWVCLHHQRPRGAAGGHGVVGKACAGGSIPWAAWITTPPGLLLLTNDGELAYRLTHPSYQVPRTYRVTVAGEVSKEKVRQLSAGVDLDGRFVYPEVQVNKREAEKTVLEITVHEGRYHLIKRLMDQVGHPVVKLKRIVFGPLKLEGLLRGSLPGGYRREMAALKARVDLK